MPPHLRVKTPTPALEDPNTIGGWQVFGNDTVNSLKFANDRFDTAMWILDQCDQEERAAVTEITKWPWEFWK